MKLTALPRTALRIQWRLVRLPLTVFEVVTGDGPDQGAARKGLVGRTKQLVGVVLGDDAAVAEGALQEATANKEREAAANETVAATKRERAEEEFSSHRQLTEQRRAEVAAERAREKSRLEAERAQRKAEAEAEVRRRERTVEAAARAKKKKAASKRAQADRQRAQRTAAAAAREESAEELERKAETLARARTKT